MMAYIIYLLLTLSLLLFLKAKTISSKHNYRHLPGPWTLPIIGSLHHLINGYHLPYLALHKLSQRYGHLMFLQLGELPTVVVSSREGARMIIKTGESTFCDRPSNPILNKLTYGGQDIALLPYGDYWRQIRKIINSRHLSLKRVQSFRSIREEEVSDLIQLISSTSCHRHTINLSEMMSVMANKVSVRAVSGSKSKHELLFVNEFRRSAALALGFSLINLFPSSHVARLISRRQIQEVENCHRSLDQLLDKIIQDHGASEVGGEEDNLLTNLLRLSKNSISMDTAKAILFVSHSKIFIL